MCEPAWFVRKLRKQERADMTLDSVHTRTHTCVLKRHSKWIALLLLLLRSIYPEHTKSFVDSSSSYVLSMSLIRRFRVIILRHLLWRFLFIITYLKHARRRTPPILATTMSVPGFLKGSICSLFLLARCHFEANLHGCLNKV